MKRLLLIGLLFLSASILISLNFMKEDKKMNAKEYPKSFADYSDFKKLVLEVEPYRNERLISLDTFLKMSKEENTVILDTRSDFRYDRKHLKGAIHLDFTNFTQQALWDLIPNPDTRILIYCNNNFEGDQIDFTSKISIPDSSAETQILSNRKPIMLALNIPTYINLYGYGFRNIYELDELVNVNDPRIVFEGTVVSR